MTYLILALVLGIIVGANDAVNVFGSAIGSKMLKFSRAILFFIIFIILGAIVNAQYPSAIYQNIIPSYFSIDKTFINGTPKCIDSTTWHDGYSQGDAPLKSTQYKKLAPNALRFTY